MNIFRSLHISASALTAERLRMDVISNNIANSQTTRGADGEAYRRKQVVFSTQEANRSPVARFRRGADPAQAANLAGVEVRGIIESDEEMVRAYDPGHPDADEEGFVTFPNVDITTEMVDMMAASKAYQANVSVIQTAKSLARAALQIGK